MIDGKSVLAVIPARGGSKGVPRKNIRMVAGKPLIAWTIEEARKSSFIDRMILSSEDEEIITVARAWGCEVPFVRPPELARDDTPGIDPVLHAIKMIPGYDYVVVLQPTSPMRKAADIDGCIEQCVRQGSGACVSVTEADKSPYWMFVLDGVNRMRRLIAAEVNISRRQDLPRVYVLNGAVYVAGCDWLLRTGTFLHEETTAFTMDRLNSIDIDSELDIKVCELLLSGRD